MAAVAPALANSTGTSAPSAQGSGHVAHAVSGFGALLAAPQTAAPAKSGPGAPPTTLATATLSRPQQSGAQNATVQPNPRPDQPALPVAAVAGPHSAGVQPPALKPTARTGTQAGKPATPAEQVQQAGIATAPAAVAPVAVLAPVAAAPIGVPAAATAASSVARAACPEQAVPGEFGNPINQVAAGVPPLDGVSTPPSGAGVVEQFAPATANVPGDGLGPDPGRVHSPVDTPTQPTQPARQGKQVRPPSGPPDVSTAPSGPPAPGSTGADGKDAGGKGADGKDWAMAAGSPPDATPNTASVTASPGPPHAASTSALDNVPLPAPQHAQDAPPAHGAAPVLAPVLASSASEAGQGLAVRVAQALQDGNRTLSIELHPAELGRVEVRLSFHDGGVGVQITMGREETYEAFSRGRTALEQQFAQAGIDLGSGGLDLRFGQPREHAPSPAAANFRFVAASGTQAAQPAQRPRSTDSLLDIA